MVKFKEGYVMNAREKAEFDRVNALSRKTSGRIDFYYKPQTKYPPRIYLFMHAEHGATVTAGRWGFSTPDDQKEIEYHHFNIRLCYLRRLE